MRATSGVQKLPVHRYSLCSDALRRIAALMVAVSASIHAAVPDTFARLCASCHGGDGLGGERAPAAAARGRSDAAIADLIRAGIPNRGMPAFDISGTRLADL